ncbi:MAG: type 1 glutamine amidotransferase [bacterium]
MRIHYLQHVPFEDPGYILQWARDKGHRLTATRFFENDTLPKSETFDWLIVMGGPMSVHDQKRYPWLNEEITVIRESIHRHKTVLGICLGAQLIATALGSNVYPNPQKEIGWFPIHRTIPDAAENLFAGLPETLKVFHWHGETFDNPGGALKLASSDGCVNQAFLFQKSVLGLQCHLEVTLEGVNRLIENCADDIIPGPYVQTIEAMRNERGCFEQNHRFMTSVLDRLADLTHVNLEA